LQRSLAPLTLRHLRGTVVLLCALQLSRWIMNFQREVLPPVPRALRIWKRIPDRRPQCVSVRFSSVKCERWRMSTSRR
jgi:hypothetical protein